MIIGITGTLGAGKGTVADYLAKKHGFTYLSVRNFFAKELLRQGKAVNRDTIRDVANELRAAHGPNYATEQLLSQIPDKKTNVVIESIRTLGEAEFLKSHGAVLWAVDAEIHTRYGRIVKRASVTDSVSFEKFAEDEAKEMTSTDPNKQNLIAVRDVASVVFRNDGTQEELYAEVEKALQNRPS